MERKEKTYFCTLPVLYRKKKTNFRSSSGSGGHGSHVRRIYCFCSYCIDLAANSLSECRQSAFQLTNTIDLREVNLQGYCSEWYMCEMKKSCQHRNMPCRIDDPSFFHKFFMDASVTSAVNKKRQKGTVPCSTVLYTQRRIPVKSRQ